LERALEAGANDYLIKPLDPARLNPGRTAEIRHSFFQDVGHFSDCFLQSVRAWLRSAKRTKAPLSYESRTFNRAGSSGLIKIVGAGFQRPFQVLRVITRR